MLILRNGVDLLRINHVQQMMWHERPFFSGNFSSAYIKATVSLASVLSDNLTMNMLGQGDPQGTFPGRGWAEPDDQVGLRRRVFLHTSYFLNQGRLRFTS